MPLTWQDLDDMVEGDPLALRDLAWEEIKRLRAEVVRLDGHRAVLAERCARKDLELDELRHSR